MGINYVRYDLQDGYIHNWLIAGPQAISAGHRALDPDDLGEQMDDRSSQVDLAIKRRPIEGASLNEGDTAPSWRYLRCPDDHLVDLGDARSDCRRLRAWAYARLACRSVRNVSLVLTVGGAADVWVNGQHSCRQESSPSTPLGSATFAAALRKGHNEILMRLEQAADERCFCMALRVAPPSEKAIRGISVLLPSTRENSGRRQRLEQVFDAAYLDRDIYVEDDEITVHLPDGMSTPTSIWVRLQSPSGSIYAEHGLGRDTENVAQLGRAFHVPEGRHEAFLMPGPEEYYAGGLRVHRKIPLWTTRHRYSQNPYGGYAQRRHEALEDASEREAGVFSEIAKMELGRWSDVRADAVMRAAEAITQRGDRCGVDLVALLGMIQRYGGNASFPEKLRQELAERVLGFSFHAEEGTGDTAHGSSESRQVLSHTAQILAGQLYPDGVFLNSGHTGQWHREMGERMVATWCHDRAMGGFSQWDSHSAFEEGIVALSHLADLAATPQVYDWASVLMDKMFLSMALNSYRGVFGSSHGRACASMVKGGRLEATAGIGRLMWGMGAFNHHMPGVVSLACAKAYELPPHIRAIAADLPDEMWNRERHVGEPSGSGDRAGAWEVNKVTYKTPDYMLCSAQDYYPGQAGDAEHIWQATMGPDAVVFVTHPSRASDDATRGAGFWLGNGTLPRVAQWKDVLIAIYKMHEHDWMGFTHAYFPTYAFDEYLLRGGWAFARKGGAYLALTASQGLELVSWGDSAYRELRSYGRQNVWLCHMGRSALDGDFGAFQAQVLALDIAFEGLSVEFSTLRGERLVFGWEGHLLRDRQEQVITGFKHYDNDYCVAEMYAKQMDILYNQQVLRLDFDLQGAP